VTGRRRILVLDIVGPLLVYRACRAAGVPDVWSLVLSGLPPLLGVLSDWLRWRTLEVVGAFVLAGISLSVVIAVLTDDARIVLLESAAWTGVFGLASFLSLATRRPLLFHFAQAFYGGRHSAAGAELDDDYEQYAEARSFFRVVTIVWGVVFLLEAAGKVFVTRVAGTGTALTVNRTVPWLVFAVLLSWTLWWGNRLRARRPTDSAPAGQGPA
jgi:hypothetical protein